MGFLFKRRETCNEDRISRLPDSVLTHILSFLPTKSAVATSVLSRGWKDQWRSVTNLNFDDTLFRKHSFDYLSPNHKRIFMDLIDQVMTNRDNRLNIDKFYVSCGQHRHCNVNRLTKGVNLAIRQKVKEMILDIYTMECFYLPKATFACETLVILKLHHNIVVHVDPNVVSLPSLKVLHFCHLRFAKYESVEMIAKGCPLLEELMIKNCKWMQGSVLRIIGFPILKKLTISMSGISLSYRENELVVDVPSLEYLDLQDYMSENFTMLNLGSLVDVKINVSHQMSRFVSANEYGNRVFALLHGISNIRSLLLGRSTLEALHRDYENDFPTFSNLTKLDLFFGGMSRWAVLSKILAASPILETLNFSDGLPNNIIFEHGVSPLDLSSPKNVPNCLLLHLKEIEIKMFHGGQDELIIIQYFLKNALVLERISIFGQLLRNDYNTIEKLKNFDRGSRKCRTRLSFNLI